MKFSKNWRNWLASIDEKTCRECRRRHGKIYSKKERISPRPPIHAIVPAGGIDKERKWRNSKKKFFIPVKVLSRKFRGKFLYYLKQEKLEFYGENKYLEIKENFDKLMAKLYNKEWVSYCKPPFKDAKKVIKYLGRYTHRVAIANSRIIKEENGEVTFKYRDYKENNEVKPGDRILVDDGAIEFKVVEIKGKDVVCKTMNTGLLGYGITSEGKISVICENINDIRRNITLEIIEDLKKRGYYFDDKYLKRFYEKDDVVLSKVDISKLLVKCGYAKTVKEAFYGILKPYNVGSKVRQNAEEIILSIKEDNGISILAHPGEISKKQKADIVRVIDGVCEIGIDGIEVCTPKHTIEDELEFLKIARKKNILVTGGSDYHGEITKPGITLCDNVKEELISEEVKKKCIKH